MSGERPTRQLTDRQRTRIATWMKDRIDIFSDSVEKAFQNAYMSLEADSTWDAGSLTTFPADSLRASSTAPPSFRKPANSSSTPTAGKSVRFADLGSGADSASSGSSTSTGPGGMSLRNFLNQRLGSAEDQDKQKATLIGWLQENEANKKAYKDFMAAQLATRSRSNGGDSSGRPSSE